MIRSILTTFALLVASLSSAFVLTGREPLWVDGAGAMVAVGHLLLTTTTIVAALVGAARWSVPLGVALSAFLAVPAVLHPVGPAWVVMVAAGGLALAGLLGTGLRGTVRSRPSADGPPRKASILTLGLLASPMLVGVLQPGGVGVADWLLAAAGTGAAAWYAKARPGALWVVRLGVPVLAAVSLAVIPLPAAMVALAAFGAMGWLAWSADARVAVMPLATPGRAVPIPPELAPGEILDAAGLDDRGRPKGR